MGARAANGNIEYNHLLNHIPAYFHTPRFRYEVSLVFFYPLHMTWHGEARRIRYDTYKIHVLRGENDSKRWHITCVLYCGYACTEEAHKPPPVKTEV